MGETIDLGNLFQAVTRDLVKNQQALNQADGYNQDHGDNMVRTFQTITKAVKLKQKQGSSDSAALAYAAKRLTKSGIRRLGAAVCPGAYPGSNAVPGQADRPALRRCSCSDPDRRRGRLPRSNAASLPRAATC